METAIDNLFLTKLTEFFDKANKAGHMEACVYLQDLLFWTQHQIIHDQIIHDQIFLVEDGSVDVDALEEQGYKVIVYRQGSTPPQLIRRDVNE